MGDDIAFSFHGSQLHQPLFSALPHCASPSCNRWPHFTWFAMTNSSIVSCIRLLVICILASLNKLPISQHTRPYPATLRCRCSTGVTDSRRRNSFRLHFDTVGTIYGMLHDRHGNKAISQPAVLCWLNKRFLGQRKRQNVDLSDLERNCISQMRLCTFFHLCPPAMQQSATSRFWNSRYALTLALVRPLWGFCIVRFRCHPKLSPAWVSTRNHNRTHHHTRDAIFTFASRGQSCQPRQNRPCYRVNILNGEPPRWTVQPQHGASNITLQYRKPKATRTRRRRPVLTCVGPANPGLMACLLKAQAVRDRTNHSILDKIPCSWRNPSLHRQGRLMQVPSNLRTLPEYFPTVWAIVGGFWSA
jgi:hypothetical protein